MMVVRYVSAKKRHFVSRRHVQLFARKDTKEMQKAVRHVNALKMHQKLMTSASVHLQCVLANANTDLKRTTMVVKYVNVVVRIFALKFNVWPIVNMDTKQTNMAARHVNVYLQLVASVSLCSVQGHVLMDIVRMIRVVRSASVQITHSVEFIPCVGCIVNMALP
jgi:hypothetical protein